VIAMTHQQKKTISEYETIPKKTSSTIQKNQVMKISTKKYTKK